MNAGTKLLMVHPILVGLNFTLPGKPVLRAKSGRILVPRRGSRGLSAASAVRECAELLPRPDDFLCAWLAARLQRVDHHRQDRNHDDEDHNLLEVTPDDRDAAQKIARQRH